MTLGQILKATIFAVAVAGGASTAMADSNGLDSIHTQVKVGRKICFADHSHNGSGSGATRAAAEYQAIDAWTQFTALEYGTDWAHINKAVKKSMTCNQVSAGWNCDVAATPCK
jgi:hypothetical protein